MNEGQLLELAKKMDPVYRCQLCNAVVYPKRSDDIRTGSDHALYWGRQLQLLHDCPNGNVGVALFIGWTH